MSDWTRVCRLTEIALGGSREAEIDGEELLLCRTGEDIVHAVQNVCTHDDGPLGEADLSGGVIECPRHGARFDVTTGAVLRMPAATPLRTYPARVADGWVEVATGDGS